MPLTIRAQAVRNDRLGIVDRATRRLARLKELDSVAAGVRVLHFVLRLLERLLQAQRVGAL